MGAWGAKSFDNDDAADFLAELAEAGDPHAMVSETLAAVDDADDDESIEAPDASAAIAAAEVVAAWRGRPCGDPPGELAALPAADVDDELLALANRAAARVFEDSELRDLWEEDDDSFSKWEEAMGDLFDRLEPAGGRQLV